MALLCLVGVAGSCSSDRVETAAPAATSGPRDGSLSGIQRSNPPVVGGIELRDARTDTPFSLMPPKGEVMLVYFGYTSCPDVCPTTLSDVRRVLRSLDADRSGRVTLIFVTVDPGRDTAEVLDGYVSSFVDSNHVVRIEDQTALRDVQRPFGARSELGPKHEDGTYEVAHTGVLYAVNDEGKVAVEWPFGTDSDTIAHDLGILLAATGS